jgi:hypothetical protein
VIRSHAGTQSSVQAPERSIQAASRARVIAIPPQNAGYMVSRKSRIAVDEEIAEEFTQTSSRQFRDWPVDTFKLQRAEEAYV